MWFPIDTQNATLINGVWEIDFPPNNRDRELKWISIKGPASSSCDVYLDTIFLDTTARGDFNRADYFGGTPIAKGRILRLIWSVGTGTAPQASIGCTDGGTTSQAVLTGNDSLFTA